MIQGIDCATPLTAELAAKFKADGQEFVGRYLVPKGAWKALTRPEVEAISAAGLKIISVFETTAGRPKGGYEAGLEDGATALTVAAEVGQPPGSCIYFAVDFDAMPSEMWTIIEYLRGCRETTPGYTIGVYGKYEVMIAIANASVADKYWQTYAWSRNQRAEFINIYQWKNDVVVNGIGVDHNTAYGDEGAWSLPVPTLVTPQVATMTLTTEEWGILGSRLDSLYHAGIITDYTFADKAFRGQLAASELVSLFDQVGVVTPLLYILSAEDANKVIGFLSAAHGATEDPEAQEEFHRLANELRKVSGQRVE
jgi:hypothetical protein